MSTAIDFDEVVSKIKPTILSGEDAISHAVDELCIRAFCVNPEYKLGPYLVHRMRPVDQTQEGEEAFYGVHFDDVRDEARRVAESIVTMMGDMESHLCSDVVLYYESRIVAIVQYACGDGVVTFPEMQVHY